MRSPPVRVGPTLVVLAMTWTLLAAAADAQAPAPQPVDQPTTQPVDQGWPRVYERGDQKVVIYQPQVDSWDNYTLLALRAAISVTPGRDQETVYGVYQATARTEVDFEARQVLVMPPDSDLRFPNVPEERAAQLEALAREVVPRQQAMVISLDRVLAYLSPEQEPIRTVELNLDPPPIFYSSEPAILLTFMGRPRFKPIEGTQLLFAVNTNWDVFFDEQTQQYFLLEDPAWLQTMDPVKGPWELATRLPAGFNTIPNTPEWADVRNALTPPADATPPKVFATTQPAELIQTNGEPAYEPVSGTKLLAVANTESVLFRYSGDGSYYLLTAGRWFNAPELAGPWTAASTSLPEDFQRIPADDPRAFVLASVPGTDEAADAVLLASVPRQAVVNVKDVSATVEYSGAPQFQPIPDTTIQYAVNTSASVLLVDGKYYCCQQGVWFEAPTPTGPWSVCRVVPQVIYTIPVSHPMHNVTYVYVYDSTPDTVTVAHTSGYSGEYVAATGVLMFGAGMLLGAAIADDDDDDWYHYHYGYHWHSYGCGAHYDHWRGTYYRGGAVYGPYAGIGRAGAYNPYTGSWARSGYRYGPNGAVVGRQGYHAPSGTYGAQIGGANAYGSWSRGVATRGDDWVRGGTRSDARGTVGWAETSRGGAAIAADTVRREGAVVRTGEGDVYVGSDNGIYRRTDEGTWQKRDGSSWNSVDRSTYDRSTYDRSNYDRSTYDRSARPDQRSYQQRTGSQTRTPSDRRTSGQRDYSSRSSRSLDSQYSARARGNVSSARASSRSGGARTGGSRGGARGGGRR